jgi:hypothetical protein
LAKSSRSSSVFGSLPPSSARRESSGRSDALSGVPSGVSRGQSWDRVPRQERREAKEKEGEEAGRLAV